jgi:cytochrome c556
VQDYQHGRPLPQRARRARSKSPRLILGIVAGLALILTIAASTARSQNPSAPSAPMSHHAAQSDQRRPLRLTAMMAAHQKRNMREHLVAVQEIVAALGINDWPRVEAAARKIGYNQQMGRMCNMMGAATPGFTPMALNFHHSADRIADAAKRHDRQAALRALGDTLTTCTGCHATFRQEVVDQQIWQRLVGDAKSGG